MKNEEKVDSGTLGVPSSMVPVTRAELKLTFNNKGLKMLFPGTVVTRKKLEMGELDPKFLASSIKSSELRYTYTNFVLEDIELEGEFNKWDVILKLRLI